MRTGIDPLVDCVFKRLFGSEDNKNLLIEMVNAIFEKGGEPKVVEVELVDPYNPRNFIGDKMSIVDIKARTETGEWIIVEVQVQMSASFPKRLLYYWACSYQNQIKQGERYHRLQKVTLICVSKYELPIAGRRYWNHFRVLETRDGICLCPDLSIYTIELARFPQTIEKLTDVLEKWAYFLKHGEELDEERLPETLQAPSIQQAVKELKMFTQDEIERALYESRRKAYMDEQSLIGDYYEEGRQQGVKQGREQGIEQGREQGIEQGREQGIEQGIETGRRETALKLLGIGMMPVEQIAEITGLGVDVVEELRREENG